MTYTYAVDQHRQHTARHADARRRHPAVQSPTRGADTPGNGDAVLDVGETWNYSCAGVVDPVTNIATVTATPLNPLNGNAPFVGANPAVTDFDSARRCDAVDPVSS